MRGGKRLTGRQTMLCGRAGLARRQPLTSAQLPPPAAQLPMWLSVERQPRRRGRLDCTATPASPSLLWSGADSAAAIARSGSMRLADMRRVLCAV